MTKQLILALLGLLLIYGAIEAWPLVRGPRFVVTAPTDNASIEGGIVNITGHSTHVSVLTLNGSPLLYDQNGDFSSTMAFPQGSSILTFKAADRFGRTTTVTRTIFVP